MTEAAPIFTVIVPTHNRPSQLARCIEALANLDYPVNRFEIVIVDDGGTTSLEGIQNIFGQKLSLTVLRQERAGPSSARNTGARNAKGRFLAMTDDDCAPATDWLTCLERCFENDPHLLYGGRTINGLPHNRYSATSQIIIEVVYALQEEWANFPRFFATNNFALASESFQAIGGFSEYFQTSEDREFCDRWTHDRRGMTYVPGAVVHHSHDLDFAALMRQHFHYGRGAFQFHRLRAQRGWGKFAFYGKFYIGLLQRCRAWRFTDRLILAGLLICTQLASAAGFTREAWKRAEEQLPVSPIPAAVEPSRSEECDE
jgi:glycosyltransferase involved in cell wall biosynthesis